MADVRMDLRLQQDLLAEDFLVADEGSARVREVGCCSRCSDVYGHKRPRESEAPRRGRPSASKWTQPVRSSHGPGALALWPLWLDPIPLIRGGGCLRNLRELRGELIDQIRALPEAPTPTPSSTVTSRCATQARHPFAQDGEDALRVIRGEGRSGVPAQVEDHGRLLAPAPQVQRRPVPEVSRSP
jgi:hypothetical protein